MLISIVSIKMSNSEKNPLASSFTNGVCALSQVLNSGIVIEIVRTLVKQAPAILGPIGVYIDAALYFCKALYHMSFTLLELAGCAQTTLRPEERSDKWLAAGLDLFCVAAFVVAGCGILGLLPVAVPLEALIGWSVAMTGVSVHCYNEHYQQYRLVDDKRSNLHTVDSTSNSSHPAQSQSSATRDDSADKIGASNTNDQSAKTAFYLYSALIVGMVLMFGVGAAIPLVAGAVATALGIVKIVGSGVLVALNVGRLVNFMCPDKVNKLTGFFSGSDAKHIAAP